MQNKFNLTLEQNIFVAKKTLVANIYSEMKIEGSLITFPQTQTILDGVSVAGLRMDDVEKVLNLRDAWKFLLETAEQPLDISYANKINSFVSRNESLAWGVLRTGSVGISGTDYIPPIPTTQAAEEDIKSILASEKSDTEKGIELFLNGCRKQYYWDGNKRTSNLVANKYLISQGKGVLTVPDKHLLEFNTELAGYYTTDDWTDIKALLYDVAIQGLELQQEMPQDSGGFEIKM